MRIKKSDLVFAEICMKGYKEAVFRLKKISLHEQEEFPKGCIINKTIYKKTESKTYSYNCKVLQTKESVNGKIKTVHKYIPKDKIEETEQQIAKRNEHKQTLKILEAEIRMWEKKLMPFVRQGIVDLSRLTYETELLLQAEKHHYSNLNKNLNNPGYGIVTESGCLVRSKSEAIFANAEKIKI